MTPALATVTLAASACSAFISSPGETALVGESERKKRGRKKSVKCEDTDIEE